MKNIQNYNSKKQLHGYQETYRDATRLYYRGNYINNNMIGYTEYHFYETTRYHIK